MSDVFISYSHKDKNFVHKLTSELIRRGFSVWVDDRIDIGSRWPHVIQDSLDNCKAFIVVMSSHSYASDWVQNELNRAKDKGKPIFPLLLDGDVWLSVQATQFIDVRGDKLPPACIVNLLS